jgi:hypothetical protein
VKKIRSLLIVVVMPLAACSTVEWRSPLMANASGTSTKAPVPADRARVVFLQVSSRDYPNKGLVRIADEHGHVLGDSLPSASFSADVAPGAHEFFGWETMRETSGMADCSCFLHQCYYVAAMRANLLAGRTYYVQVGIRDDSSGEFIATEHVDFQRVSSDLDSWPRSFGKHLQPITTKSEAAEEFSQARAGAYASSFVCVGRARMREERYWDPIASTLLPDDGSASAASPHDLASQL